METTETKEKLKNYSLLIEITYYKIIGCKACKESDFACKPATLKELKSIAANFRNQLEQRDLRTELEKSEKDNTAYFKTSFATIVNKCKNYYKGKSDLKTQKRLQIIKKYFSITDNETIALKQAYKSKVDNRLQKKDDFAINNNGATDIVNDFPLLMSSAKKMLVSAKYQDIVTSLAFFTGRRMIEILYTGCFYKSKRKNTILFSGVAKKGYDYHNLQPKEDKKYEIPCLIDSELILKAYNRLQLLKSKYAIKSQIIASREKFVATNKLSEISNNISELEITSLINSSFNKTCNISAKELLAPSVIKVDKTPSFHDLRKIYFCACVENLRAKNETTANYAKKVLLHDVTETGLTYDTWIISDIENYVF